MYVVTYLLAHPVGVGQHLGRWISSFSFSHSQASCVFTSLMKSIVLPVEHPYHQRWNLRGGEALMWVLVHLCRFQLSLQVLACPVSPLHSRLFFLTDCPADFKLQHRRNSLHVPFIQLLQLSRAKRYSKSHSMYVFPSGSASLFEH